MQGRHREAGARRAGRRWLWYALALLVLAGALILNAPGLIELGYKVRYTRVVSALKPLRRFTPADRLLVIAPHPDDEMLACAGTILAARRAGARVHVVWLTSGDGFEWDEFVLSRDPLPGRRQMLDLGTLRMAEARRSMTSLGLKGSDYTFLGYPDGGLLHMSLAYYERPYTSRYTGCDHVPYSGVQSPGAPYTGMSLEHDLGLVADRLQPTLVFAPSSRDRHPDHRAACFDVLRVFGRRGWQDRLMLYIVHGGLEWPVPKGLHRTLPLEPAPRGRKLAWLRVDLSPADLILKEGAVRKYSSQLRTMAHFLLAFIRTNELVTPQAELE